MFAVEWSDWVVRLPGGGGSTEGALLSLLIAVFVFWALLKGVLSAGEHIRGYIAPVLLLLFVVFGLYLFNETRTEDVDGPTRTVVIGEEDCESQILDRCPTQDTVAGG